MNPPGWAPPRKPGCHCHPEPVECCHFWPDCDGDCEATARDEHAAHLEQAAEWRADMETDR